MLFLCRSLVVDLGQRLEPEALSPLPEGLRILFPVHLIESGENPPEGVQGVPAGGEDPLGDDRAVFLGEVVVHPLVLGLAEVLHEEDDDAALYLFHGFFIYCTTGNGRC